MTGADPVVVADLLHSLGPSVLHALSGGTRLSVPVRDVLLHDPLEGMPAAPGSVVLGVGVPTASPVALGLVRDAAAAGAAAVLVKLHGESPTELLAAADESGIALVAVDDHVPWQHVMTLLTTAVAAPPPPGASAVSGDLFSLANAVAATVGGAISIEDPQRRVLAYSNLADQPIDEARREGILGRRAPEFPVSPSTYRRLWRSSGVVRTSLDEGFPRLAVAVRAGNEVLGSIWAVESEPLGRAAEEALEDAARLAALHLLRTRTAAAVERRSRAELLRVLLNGNADPETAAARLGVPAEVRTGVLGFEVPADCVDEPALCDQVADLVHVACQSHAPASVCLAEGRMIYALVPLRERDRERDLVRLAEQVVARSSTVLKVPLRVAVGEVVPGLGQVPDARRQVDQVLCVLGRSDQGPGVTTVDQARAQIALLELEQLLRARSHLTLPAVTRMIRHDRDKHTAYRETVVAYLDAFGDVNAASERVRLHPNSFRHRLRRVRELFDVDLDDADQRLLLWLQLRLDGST